MKKKVGIIKQLLCIGLVFLIQINSFAAIVSDNDGSAFITKAEFDALKNSFQTQIDTYNTSIDSKIDGAIASYLAGISLTTTETRTVSLNPENEKCLFMTKDTDPELINFYGTMGLEFDSVMIATTTGSSGSLHGGQIWKASSDAKPFENALVRYDNGQIKLLKDVNITWVCVEYGNANFFDTPSNPSGLKLSVFRVSYVNKYSNWTTNGVQNKLKIMPGNDLVYFAPTLYKETMYDKGWMGADFSKYYLRVNPFRDTKSPWLPKDVKWNSYTDDNIRCLFSGESSWNQIECFSDPKKTKFNYGEALYGQHDNGSPYRLVDQNCKMWIVDSSLSTNATTYKGEAYACTTWLTFDDTDEKNEGPIFNYTSLLPPVSFVGYSATSDLKDFNGSNIKINDGFPFFKNIDDKGELAFELECVTPYGSDWTVFVTDEPMSLSSRSTVKKKVNIKKQGDIPYSQSVTWTSTSPLKLQIETEKDKQYYIYVMNTSTGESPIFKIKDEGTQVIVHDD